MKGSLRAMCVGALAAWLPIACATSSSEPGLVGASPDGGKNDNDGGGGDAPIANGDSGSTVDADLRHGDADAQVACAASANPPASKRGLAWTRKEPMFVSGLVVGLPVPSVAEVNDYFDAFGANAVHTWASGLPASIAGFRAANHAGFRYVSWVQADGTSVTNGQLLGGVGAASAGRIGFQIGDEPVDEASLDVMLQSATTIRAVDPDALLIVNFADRPNTDALLAKAVGHADVDVLSVDQYSYKDNVYSLLSRVRAQGVAAGKPYWRYTDSYTENGDASPAESDMRWDAMVGLIYGFTGLTWFIYQVDAGGTLAPELFAANGSFSASKTSRYAVASTINHEVRNLGRTLTQLTSTDVRYVAGTAFLQPKATVAWSKGAGGQPYLAGLATDNGLHDVHAGFFRDECGESYVMLMNPAHAAAKFPLSGEAATVAKLTFDFAGSTDGSLDETQIETLDPKDGKVKTRALTPAGARNATLEFTLGPGEVVLFKHRNAQAFATQ